MLAFEPVLTSPEHIPNRFHSASGHQSIKRRASLILKPPRQAFNCRFLLLTGEQARPGLNGTDKGEPPTRHRPPPPVPIAVLRFHYPKAAIYLLDNRHRTPLEVFPA